MRDNRKISFELLKDYFERYCNGESVKTISAELNMIPNTLTCKFRNAGLIKPFRSPHAHLPLSQIYDEHQLGVQYKELAKKYGVKYKTLRRLLKIAGFQSEIHKVIRVNLKDVWDRYKKGEALKKIAEETGISPKELSRRLSKKGYIKARKIDNYSFDQIEKLRIELGGNLKKVAEKLDLNLCSLKRWYYNRGLSIRGYKLKDETFFSDINTPEKSYFLGFIYADGYLNEQRNFVRIKINKTDIHILQLFTKLIFDGDKKVPNWFEDGRKVCALIITSQIMTKDLKKHGVHQRKASTIKFPGTIEPELMNHFIRGYFDGDGSVYLVKKGTYGNIIRTGFACNSYQFINALREYFIGLEFHPTKLSKTDSTYRMNMGRKADMVKLKEFLYTEAPKGLYLERKHKKFNDLDDGKCNPHKIKFTKEFRQGISKRVSRYHKQYKYSRYKECVVTDHQDQTQVNKKSLKEACDELKINYNSAKTIWKRSPDSIYLGRYSVQFINPKS